jgi:hypothetical protein
MIVGAIVLAASIWAWRRNQRVVASEMPALWQALWRWRWLISLVLGVGSYFLGYPLDGGDNRYMVHGIPFMSYAFDQRGHGYVSPLTMPALALNFATWALLPQLIFWAFSRKKPHAQPANGA